MLSIGDRVAVCSQSQGSRGSGRALMPASIGSGQGARDVFERFALGGGGPESGDARRNDHQDCADQVADEDTVAGAGIDEAAKKIRADDAADTGPDGVENGNRQRANFEWERLADGEIGGACCGFRRRRRRPRRLSVPTSKQGRRKISIPYQRATGRRRYRSEPASAFVPTYRTAGRAKAVRGNFRLRRGRIYKPILSVGTA